MPGKRARAAALAFALAAVAPGCSFYEMRHGIQWDAREQVWSSDFSQVQTRSAQSRAYDTTDRHRTLEAVVATLQDLGFQVEVVDRELGIVSGKRFGDLERSRHAHDPLYHIYDDENLLIFTRVFRTWGPFWHRTDLVRLTVTVRPRNEQQLVVRASAQFALQPVEQPEVYLHFFQTLSKSMFVDQHLL